MGWMSCSYSSWECDARPSAPDTINNADILQIGCRVTDSLMQHGRNNGKKMMAVRIIRHSFEIIHLLTDQNPIQVLVDAIINR